MQMDCQRRQTFLRSHPFPKLRGDTVKRPCDAAAVPANRDIAVQCAMVGTFVVDFAVRFERHECVPETGRNPHLNTVKKG